MQAERPSSMISSPSLDAYAQVHDQPSNKQQRMIRDQYEEEDVNNNNSGLGGSGIFEFSFDCAEAVSSPIPADQIFHNGRIKPMYNDQLAAGANMCPEPGEMKAGTRTSRRKALRRLFTEERQHSSSSSEELATESESSLTELDSVPSHSYCVWEPPPKTTTTTNEKAGNSSSSSSSSKRWKLRDLLTRNVSSGKDTHSHSHSQSHSRSRSASVGNIKINPIKNSDDKVEATPQLARKTAMKEGGGRRSYLPYRQELVGIFGSGRNLQRTR